MHIIDEIVHLSRKFLAAYGWYLVFALLIYYFSQPYIAKLREQISLAQANDPQRRAVLDRQRQAIRVKQQKENLAKSANAGNTAKDGGEEKDKFNREGRSLDEEVEDSTESRVTAEKGLPNKKND